MLKIMKSIWIGLFVTLFLVGHVHASPGGHGGGGGGTFSNPYRPEDLFADYDAEPEDLFAAYDAEYEVPWDELIKQHDNLTNALDNIEVDGKKLTELEKQALYNALISFLNKVEVGGKKLTETQKSVFYLALRDMTTFWNQQNKLGMQLVLVQLIAAVGADASKEDINNAFLMMKQLKN